ncbi:MAG: putative sensor domain DACNV-containing protein [Acidobacteriota bacterium]
MFTAHAAAARRRGQDPVATIPDAEAIEAIIGAAFWASLRREEGYAPKISLAFLAPGETVHPMLFARPLPLEAAPLTRVAPAVERAGIHLGVWPEGGDLAVWGTTRSIPATCFVVEVAAPGLLVVKHHRGGEWGKFVNVAVLEGDQIKIVDQDTSNLPDRPALLSSLVSFDSMAPWGDSVNILVQLAVSMRAHGRGGLLLLVPPGTDAWRESIVRPIAYAVSPPFSELAELCQDTPAARQRREWRDSLARVVQALAGLTAVDGAAIITSGYELLAFGAKIARRKGSPQIEQVTVTEPIEGAVHRLVDPTELGGTRHLSAAQFVHDQRDALALVASQDGRFTVFAWSPGATMVHAHRVEVLLL